MRLIGFPCLVVVAALLGAACEPTAPPADTDTGPKTSSDSATDSGSSGATSTTTGEPDPTIGEPQTSSSSSSSFSSSGESSGSDEPVDPTGDPTPCEGEATPIDASALAILVEPTEPNCGDGTTGCGDGPPAGSLDVQLWSEPRACGEDVDVSACGTWRLRFNIPPELQAPGLYHLTGPTIHGYAGITEPGDGPCATHAEFLDATLEILAVDETGVSGRLCHVQSRLYAGAGADVEGSFFAPRCE